MADSPAREVGVVHLARCVNGIEPLRRFLESYEARPAGIPHDLILVFKGFAGNPAAKAEAVGLIADLPCRLLEIADDGFDLDAYRAAARAFDHPYLLFFNSHSVIAADGWLAAMHACASRSESGIVGATGSWESLLSDEMGLLARSLRARVARTGREGGRPPAGVAPPAPEARGLKRLWSVLRDYKGFPNAHVRTNAFMLARAFIDRLDWPATLTKSDAYRMESGRRGFTAQAFRLGLKPAIVGKDGRAYFHEDWPVSGTFWQGAQENLLVEDNQTREYQTASADERGAMAYRAWRSSGGA